MKKALLLSILFYILSTSRTCATINTQGWEQIGLGGGGTYQSIGFSPVINSSGTYDIYLGGDTLGLFKSVNNGQSWKPVSNGLYDNEVSKIIVNSNNQNIIYLTTQGGFYKSIDGGNSWTPKNFGRAYSTYGARNNMLASMAVDPKNPNIIYIGTGYLRNNALPPDNTTQIFKSIDGGETWGSAPIYNSTGQIVYGLAVNPNNSQSLYATLGYKSTGKLIHSKDGGLTWTSLDSISSHVYYNLEIDKNNNIYASGWNGALMPSGQCGAGGTANAAAMRLTKYNETSGIFTDITPSRTASYHLNSTCKMALSTNGTLYISDNDSWSSVSVWKCDNAAVCQSTNWSPLSSMGRLGWLTVSRMGNPVWALGVSPDQSVWAGTSMMLYRLNSNNLWDEQYSQVVTGGYKTRGNENTVIFSPDMVFLSSNEYYFGPADIYVVGTKDKGQSFVNVAFPDADSMNDTRVFKSDVQNNNIWYVNTHKQDKKYEQAKVLKKDTAGVWTTIFTSCTTGLSCPFSAPTFSNAGGIFDMYISGNNILIATYKGGVYRSTDGGINWSNVSSLSTTSVYKFAVNKVSGQLFLSGSAGVWTSIDNGLSWAKVTAFPGTSSGATIWAGGTTWYASNNTKLYKTGDNGLNWTLVYTWQNRPDIFTAVSPTVEDISVGIKSTTNSLINPVCASFDYIANYDHLASGGLACSITGGSMGTWEQINMGGISGRGHGVEFNPYDTDELFFLSYGAGAYRTRLSVGTTTITPTSTPIIIPTVTPTRIPTIAPTPTLISSDRTSPVVSIISPKSGTTVSRNHTTVISATATDNVGVTKLEYYVNNSLKCTYSSVKSCSWSVPRQSNTTYTILVKAYDAANNMGSSSVTIRSSR